MPPSTGEDKAAFVLLNLAPEAAETVLARLGPERGGRLRERMQSLGQEPESDELAAQVLREFAELVRGAVPPAGAPGPKAEAPSPTGEAAPRLPRKAEPPPVDEGELGADPVAALRELDVEKLAAALQGEQARTVTLVLNCLEGEKAGEVLKRLQPETRRVVSLQLGKPVGGGTAVVERIARAVVRKALAVVEKPGESGDEAKYKKVADMLRLLDKTERMEILTLLEENDAETAAKIKEWLYQFQDLLRIEDRSMQKLLSEIDSKNLAVALKGAPADISEKVLNNLSKRARETLAEEMEFLGSTSSAAVRQAQKAVVEVIQRLDQAGELVMTEE